MEEHEPDENDDALDDIETILYGQMHHSTAEEPIETLLDLTPDYQMSSKFNREVRRYFASSVASRYPNTNWEANVNLPYKRVQNSTLEKNLENNQHQNVRINPNPPQNFFNAFQSQPNLLLPNNNDQSNTLEKSLASNQHQNVQINQNPPQNFLNVFQSQPNFVSAQIPIFAFPPTQNQILMNPFNNVFFVPTNTSLVINEDKHRANKELKNKLYKKLRFLKKDKMKLEQEKLNDYTRIRLLRLESQYRTIQHEIRSINKQSRVVGKKQFRDLNKVHPISNPEFSSSKSSFPITNNPVILSSNLNNTPTKNLDESNEDSPETYIILSECESDVSDIEIIEPGIEIIDLYNSDTEKDIVTEVIENKSEGAMDVKESKTIGNLVQNLTNKDESIKNKEDDSKLKDINLKPDEQNSQSSNHNLNPPNDNFTSIVTNSKQTEEIEKEPTTCIRVLNLEELNKKDIFNETKTEIDIESNKCVNDISTTNEKNQTRPSSSLSKENQNKIGNESSAIEMFSPAMSLDDMLERNRRILEETAKSIFKTSDTDRKIPISNQKESDLKIDENNANEITTIKPGYICNENLNNNETKLNQANQLPNTAHIKPSEVDISSEKDCVEIIESVKEEILYIAESSDSDDVILMEPQKDMEVVDLDPIDPDTTILETEPNVSPAQDSNDFFAHEINTASSNDFQFNFNLHASDLGDNHNFAKPFNVINQPPADVYETESESSSGIYNAPVFNEVEFPPNVYAEPNLDEFREMITPKRKPENVDVTLQYTEDIGEEINPVKELRKKPLPDLSPIVAIQDANEKKEPEKIKRKKKKHENAEEIVTSTPCISEHEIEKKKSKKSKKTDIAADISMEEITDQSNIEVETKKKKRKKKNNDNVEETLQEMETIEKEVESEVSTKKKKKTKKSKSSLNNEIKQEFENDEVEENIQKKNKKDKCVPTVIVVSAENYLYSLINDIPDKSEDNNEHINVLENTITKKKKSKKNKTSNDSFLNLSLLENPNDKQTLQISNELLLDNEIIVDKKKKKSKKDKNIIEPLIAHSDEVLSKEISKKRRKFNSLTIENEQEASSECMEKKKKKSKKDKNSSISSEKSFIEAEDNCDSLVTENDTKIQKKKFKVSEMQENNSEKSENETFKELSTEENMEINSNKKKAKKHMLWNVTEKEVVQNDSLQTSIIAEVPTKKKKRNKDSSFTEKDIEFDEKSQEDTISSMKNKKLSRENNIEEPNGISYQENSNVEFSPRKKSKRHKENSTTEENLEISINNLEEVSNEHQSIKKKKRSKVITNTEEISVVENNAHKDIDTGSACKKKKRNKDISIVGEECTSSETRSENEKSNQEEFSELIVIDEVNDSSDIEEIFDQNAEDDNIKSRNRKPVNDDTIFIHTSAQNETPNRDIFSEMDYDVTKIQSQLSSDPNMWKILALDRLGNSRRSQQGPKCYKCREVGHMASRCPRFNGPPKCTQCGKSGHTETRCPKSCCTNCGSPAPHYLTYCNKCFKLFEGVCNLCKMSGHYDAKCPNHWRRFHMTIDEGNVVEPIEKLIKPRSELWCCGCAERGHLEHECPNITRNYSTSVPYIITYGNSGEKKLNSTCTCKKNPCTCNASTSGSSKKPTTSISSNNNNNNQIQGVEISNTGMNVQSTSSSNTNNDSVILPLMGFDYKQIKKIDKRNLAYICPTLSYQYFKRKDTFAFGLIIPSRTSNEEIEMLFSQVRSKFECDMPAIKNANINGNYKKLLKVCQYELSLMQSLNANILVVIYGEICASLNFIQQCLANDSLEKIPRNIQQLLNLTDKYAQLNKIIFGINGVEPGNSYMNNLCKYCIEFENCNTNKKKKNARKHIRKYYNFIFTEGDYYKNDYISLIAQILNKPIETVRRHVNEQAELHYKFLSNSCKKAVTLPRRINL